MALKPDDHRLSMRISRRGKIDSGELRTLLIHRLSDTDKAALRRPLRKAENLNLYCENCDEWTKVGPVAPQEWTCNGCGTLFRIEFAVYEAIDREED